MKYFIISITLFTSVLSFGQNSELEPDTKNNNENKVRLSFLFSYDSNLSSDNAVFPSRSTFYKYDKLNFSLGVDLEYKINENIAIGSGINYSNKDMSSWSFCASCGEPFELKAKIRFLEVPLIGKYIMKFNKVEVSGQLGIINQFRLKNIVEFGGDDIELKNLNDFYLSGRIGLGVSYPIINKHRLFLETNYNNGFSEFFNDSDYILKTLGIRMGIQFLL